MTTGFGDGKEYTQLTNLNMLDTFRIKGVPVGTGIESRVNYVLVKTVDDFPTPSGGVITLVDDFTYEINGDISLGSGVSLDVANSTRIFSFNRGSSSLIGSTTGPMITVKANKEVFISALALTNPTGDIIDLNGSDCIAEFDDCEIDGFVDLATVAGGIARIEIAGGTIDNGTNGIVFSGNMESWAVTGNFIGINLTGTMIGLGTATVDAMNLSGNTILSANGMVLISGLVDGGNVNAGGIARVDSNNEIGSFTGILTNITAVDDGWLFSGNKRYLDTPFTGSMFLQSNVTGTNVLNGSYVKVAGTTTEGDVSRFNMSADNQMTYLDIKDIVVTINVNTSMIKSGSAQVYDVGIFKNNVLLTNSVTEIEIRNTASAVPVSITDTLSQNDFVDIRIQGVGTTDNVTVPSMQFIVSKL